MASPVVNLHPLHSYTYQFKRPEGWPQRWKTDTVQYHVNRLKTKYPIEGMRTTVSGILLAHIHNHPSIVVLKKEPDLYKLPGGRIRQGESEIVCLERKLSRYLASVEPAYRPEWQIGECVAIWWRPNLDQNIFPFRPHIQIPMVNYKYNQWTECLKLFLVNLPDRAYFEVPFDYNLVAVPFYELYDNSQKYGPLSFLPEQLSRFRFNTMQG